ncbi:MAG: Nucleoid occlusion factor SlmA [Paracidovorax wautersii]|uniref:Nucleoid occlusion factor SlmA n=1 Tax=Paracidovorax wautersii TaxID=1177982 RepID=A0A7V8JRM6_9BURK|nr:MAG: Nucleoid occlusion factor SlmA [Paracidovorax wautersii]
MTESLPDASGPTGATAPRPPDGAAPRARPKPGERRAQILQTLAAMLEQPHPERITTAALAARLGVSEAALYRHFASKAQMFEGLIDFIEQSVFSLIAQVQARVESGETDAALLAPQIVSLLLQFGEANPGLVRVMIGDALVHENERLQSRMTLFFDKIEAALKQALRDQHLRTAGSTPTVRAQVQAGVMMAFAMGRLQRFVRSGLRRLPSEGLAESLALMA